MPFTGFPWHSAISPTKPCWTHNIQLKQMKQKNAYDLARVSLSPHVLGILPKGNPLGLSPPPFTWDNALMGGVYPSLDLSTGPLGMSWQDELPLDRHCPSCSGGRKKLKHFLTLLRPLLADFVQSFYKIG